MNAPNPNPNGARVIPLDRLPADHVPLATEAEEQVLGAVLLDGMAAAGLVASILSPSDFHGGAHGQNHGAIWRAMWQLWQHKDSVNYVTVKAQLERDGTLIEAGGPEYLVTLESRSMSSAGVESYARLVKDASDRRRLVDFASDAARVAYGAGADYLTHVSDALTALKARAGVDLDAAAILDAAAMLQGADDPIVYEVRPLFEQATVSLIYSPPASHKSNLLLDLAMADMRGAAWLPTPQGGRLVDGYETAGGAAVWIDTDMGERPSKRRFAAAYRGHGLSAEMAAALPWWWVDGWKLTTPIDLSNERSAYALMRLIDARHASLVTLDTLGSAVGDIEQNSATMARPMSALRKIASDTGAAVIALHHPRKTTPGGGETRKGDAIRGSSAIEAALDSAFYIDRPLVDGVPGDVVTITPTKLRHEPIAPFGARYVRNLLGDLPAFRFHGADPVADSRSNGAIDAAARRALEVQGEMSQSALIEAVKAAGVTASATTIRTRLQAVALDAVGLWRVSGERGPKNATLYHIAR